MILAVDWFDGIAKIIVALGSLGGLVAACAAWFQANKAANIAASHTTTLARVEDNTDGSLSEIKAVAKKLGAKKDALEIEVKRLQPPEDMGTPSPPATAEHPVAIDQAGAVTTFAEKPEPRPSRGDLETDESGS